MDRINRINKIQTTNPEDLFELVFMR